tara:strand:- start:260 stop:988 length:729 start_codon:yes stop_codon:yes gene_type:complete
MAFKQIRVSPPLTGATATGALADNDVIFGLQEIELPTTGACKVSNITVISKNQDAPDAWGMTALFLNSDVKSLGTHNATAGDMDYVYGSQHVIGYGFISSRYATAANDFDEFTILSTNHTVATSGYMGPGMILQPKAGSRSVYFGCISTDDTPTYAGLCGIRINKVGGYSGSYSTIEVDTVAATAQFKKGDTVLHTGGVALGVVKDLTATTITFEEAATTTLADNDFIFFGNSLTFLIDIEY